MEEVSKEAIAWWGGLSFEERFYKTIAWLQDAGRDTTERHPDELTKKEIAEVYKVYALQGR
jgi:hypothetical protein